MRKTPIAGPRPEPRRLVIVNDLFRSVVLPVIRKRPAIVGLLAAIFSVLAVASVSLVSAQTAEVRIGELQCNSSPESVDYHEPG